jgi:hypothetical protein
VFLVLPAGLLPQRLRPQPRPADGVVVLQLLLDEDGLPSQGARVVSAVMLGALDDEATLPVVTIGRSTPGSLNPGQRTTAKRAWASTAPGRPA